MKELQIKVLTRVFGIRRDKIGGKWRTFLMKLERCAEYHKGDQKERMRDVCTTVGRDWRMHITARDLGAGGEII